MDQRGLAERVPRGDGDEGEDPPPGPDTAANRREFLDDLRCHFFAQGVNVRNVAVDGQGAGVGDRDGGAQNSSLCPSSLPSRESLSAHSRRHVDYAPWACRLCGLAFADLPSAQRHPAQRHPAERRRLILEETDEALDRRVEQLMARAQSLVEPSQTAPVHKSLIVLPNEKSMVDVRLLSPEKNADESNVNSTVDISLLSKQQEDSLLSELEEPIQEHVKKQESFVTGKEPGFLSESRLSEAPFSSPPLDSPPPLMVDRSFLSSTLDPASPHSPPAHPTANQTAPLGTTASQNSLSNTLSKSVKDGKAQPMFGIIVTHMGAPQMDRHTRKVHGVNNNITVKVSGDELSVTGILAKVNALLDGDFVLTRHCCRATGWRGKMALIEESERTKTPKYWEGVKEVFAISRLGWEQLVQGMRPQNEPWSQAPPETKAKYPSTLKSSSFQRKCLKCNWPVPKLNFGQHATTKHLGEKRFRCSLCPYRAHFRCETLKHCKSTVHRTKHAAVLDPQREEFIRRTREEVVLCFGDVSQVPDGSLTCGGCGVSVPCADVRDHLAMKHLDEVVYRCTFPGCAYTSDHWAPSNARNHAQRHRKGAGKEDRSAQLLSDGRKRLFPLLVALSKRLFRFTPRTTHYVE